MNIFKLLIFLNLITIAPIYPNIQKNIIEETSQKELNKNIKEDFYILGTGDVLIINFVSVPEYSGEYEILSDGKIYLPFNKNINLKGLSLSDAEKFIEKSINDQLLNPDVQIKILQMRPVRVAVSGQVNYPGSYTLKSGSQIDGFINQKLLISKFPNLVEAIQSAGGVKNDADIREVQLRRVIPNSKKFKTANINLEKLIFEGDQNNNPFLLDGDFIYIPKAKEMDNLHIGTSLSPNNLNVYIIGEVNSPGQYSIPVNTKLDQAILIAGGSKRNRSKSSILLSRIDKNGSTSFTRYRYGFGNNSSNNLQLRNGDILYLETNLFGKGTDLIKKIAEPAQGILNTYTLIRIIQDN